MPMETSAPPLISNLLRHEAITPDTTAICFYRAAELESRTWSELAKDVFRLASILADLGVAPGDRVAQFSGNRYEWIVIDLALQSLRGIHVPMHGTLPPRQVAAQVIHSEAKLVIVTHMDPWKGMCEAFPEISTRCRVIVLDGGNGEPSLMDRWQGGSESMGRGFAERAVAEYDPSGVTSLLYSSGTTGEPKGVALTNNNLATNAQGSLIAFGEQTSDVRLCFLPLSHIYARTCDFYTWLVRGSKLVLARSRDTVIDDCQKVHPTLLNAVPYFYERIQNRVEQSEAQGKPTTIQELLGGAIRACCCGGAALPEVTFDFFHARGVLLLPGYGLTESSPVISMSTLTEFKRGYSGKAMPGVEVRIAPDGEIQTRGPHVMQGYWRDPEATARVLQDGWLSTGDLGEIDAEGFVRISGRKKEIIVTSTGKNIFPAFVESVLCGDEFILQALVVGDDRSHLAALIVPDPDRLRREVTEQRLMVFSSQAALAHKYVRELYRSRIEKRMEDLAPHERVRRFLLLDRGFTMEGGHLTPKLSLRRDRIRVDFSQQIEDLYTSVAIDVYPRRQVDSETST
jgi:long-chain acyl-CoA synthetase